MATIALSKISHDPRLQLRAKGLDENHVAELAEVLKSGKTLGAIKACKHGSKIYPFDGWHRIAAHGRTGKTEIEADLQDGDLDHAALLAAQANCTHGLKRSNDDKRRSVKAVLDHPTGKDWSDRRIADFVGVGDKLVADLRDDQLREAAVDDGETEEKTVVRVGKDGKKRKVKASKTSTKKAAKKEEEAQSEETVDATSPDDPHAEVNSFLRSFSARVKTAETTVAALVEELGLWNHKGGSKKLPTAVGLSGSLKTCATTLRAVAAAIRDAVIEKGPCTGCNGKGGACKECGGHGYQSHAERRDADNMRTAHAPRGMRA